MDPVAHQFGPLAGLVAIFLTVSVLAVAGRQREQRGLDLVMALGLLAWMVFLVWQPRFAPQPPGPVDEFVEHMGFQLCVSAACGLALSGARVNGNLPWSVWIFQLLGGGGILLAWSVSGMPYWFDLWEATNWIVVGGVLAVLAQHWARRREQRTMGILLLSVVLLVYGAGLGLAWYHRQALNDPFASSFATLLALKILLAIGVFITFGLVAVLLRKGRMTPARYRAIHWAILLQMIGIVLLAKGMFYLIW